jgi:imidazole glycerol-phosphate synthase subunit HisF
MVSTRIIPCLQLIDESLVKAVKFGKYGYIGDPCNTVRIFNELEVDELCFLDIKASIENRPPNLQILQEISNECFMPLSYGGGIKTFEHAAKIFDIGFEKVVINTQAYFNPDVITAIATHFGVQAVVASVDVKKVQHEYKVFVKDGSYPIKESVVDYCLKLQALGAGEILLTAMDREGTWKGFDLELTSLVASKLQIPVIAHGGCGDIDNIESVVVKGHASAVAIGSMLVYQKEGMGVLVNFPDKHLVDDMLVRIRK